MSQKNWDQRLDTSFKTVWLYCRWSNDQKKIILIWCHLWNMSTFCIANLASVLVSSLLQWGEKKKKRQFFIEKRQTIGIEHGSYAAMRNFNSKSAKVCIHLRLLIRDSVVIHHRLLRHVEWNKGLIWNKLQMCFSHWEEAV